MRCDGPRPADGTAAESVVLCSARPWAALVEKPWSFLYPPGRSEAAPLVCGGTSQRGPSPITGRPGRAGFRAAHCQTASSRACS